MGTACVIKHLQAQEPYGPLFLCKQRGTFSLMRIRHCTYIYICAHLFVNHRSGNILYVLRSRPTVCTTKSTPARVPRFGFFAENCTWPTSSGGPVEEGVPPGPKACLKWIYLSREFLMVQSFTAPGVNHQRQNSSSISHFRFDRRMKLRARWKDKNHPTYSISKNNKPWQQKGLPINLSKLTGIEHCCCCYISDRLNIFASLKQAHRDRNVTLILNFKCHWKTQIKQLLKQV